MTKNEHNRGRPETEVSNMCRSTTGCRVPDRADTVSSREASSREASLPGKQTQLERDAVGSSASGACHAWLLTMDHDQAGRAQVERPHVKLTVDVTCGQ